MNPVSKESLKHFSHEMTYGGRMHVPCGQGGQTYSTSTDDNRLGLHLTSQEGMIVSSGTSKLVDKLVAYAEAFDIALGYEQAHLMLQHNDLVRLLNRNVNLTSITDPNEMLIKHSLDSLLFCAPLLNTPVLCHTYASFIDVGTGAGYPGIPFAVAMGTPGLLLDSRSKKMVALTQIVDELELSNRLKVKSSRVEDHARGLSTQYDLVLSRAVGDISLVMEYARPLLTQGGLLIVSKGQHSNDEWEHAAVTAQICGFELAAEKQFTLPEDCGDRVISVFMVVAEPSVALPRRTGVAAAKPLWMRRY